jgi:predicted glycosyltransferase
MSEGASAPAFETRPLAVAAAPAPRVIFDSHHPKHYLAVRALAGRCRAYGVEAVLTGRKKDVLIDLIRQDGQEPIVLTSAQSGVVRKLGELAVYDWKLARLAMRLRPLALVGKTVSLTHVGRLLGIPSILINDDSAEQNPQFKYLGYPFATRVLTSESLGESYGPRQRSYPGLMELAYLHPKVFTPDPDIRRELGVAPEARIFVLRLAAHDAYHDVGCTGLPPLVVERLVDRLQRAGQVFLVSEAALPDRLARLRLPVPANRLHHVLAASDLVVGDGLSVCVEAALLGRPAIVVGSYVGKIAYAEVLEKRFGLLHGFKPDQGEAIFATLESLLQPEALETWQRRRAKMLDVWADPTNVYWEELSRFLAAPAQVEA